MGNRTTAVLLFLVSTMFGFSSWGAKKSSCPSDLSEIVNKLDYVGVKFSPAGVRCVDAYNDNEGLGACSKLGKYKYINPGNKQYGDLDGNGKRDSNGLGYYLCFPNRAGKKQICEDLYYHPEKSEYNSKKNKQKTDPNFVTFKWNVHGSDGDCECAHANIKKQFGQSFRECDQKFEDLEDVTVIPEERSVICEKNNGTYNPAELETYHEVCNCPDGTKLDFDSPKKCPEISAAKAAPAEDTPVPSQGLKECVTNHEAAINKCVTDSAEAKKQCSKELTEQSKDYNSKIGVVKLFSNALIQKNAGTGAQAQCAGASLLSSGAAALLKATQDGCDTGLKACYDTCKNIEKTFKSVCSDKMLPSSQVSQASIVAEDNFVAEYDAKYKATIANAVNLCTVVAKKDSDLLKDGMNAFDAAQRSAAKCACQLSVAGPPPGIANCDSLPTIENCQATPAIPGCFGAGILNCEVGSPDFPTNKCQCSRDTSLSMCKAPPGKVPFAFAEDARIIAGGGAIGTPLSGGGGGNQDMDLGGLGARDTAPDDKGPAQGSAPGFGGGGPSGGGGSSGGGAPGGDGAGATAGGDGEPAEKNLGIMGMVKSAIGGIFGKGGGGGNAAKEPQSSGKPQRPDVNAWKPRGTANVGCKGSQVRCKNETIWDIHHEWYDGQPNLINGGSN